MSIREITPNFHIFLHEIYPTAFRVFSLLLPKFVHCFCPNFGKKQREIRAKPMGNSGKSNGKIWAKAMRKLGKRRHIFRAKIIAFARVSHCFGPNFPWLLPEFPTAFARIFRFQFFLGSTVPPPCPPPRLLRL